MIIDFLVLHVFFLEMDSSKLLVPFLAPPHVEIERTTLGAPSRCSRWRLYLDVQYHRGALCRAVPRSPTIVGFDVRALSAAKELAKLAIFFAKFRSACRKPARLPRADESGSHRWARFGDLRMGSCMDGSSWVRLSLSL